MDHPLGSPRPRCPNLVYSSTACRLHPLNYGFLPGTVISDGPPIDAYIFGLDVAVAEASSTAIAVAVRRDDVEDKLVVAVPGTKWSRQAVLESVRFRERFFQTSILFLDELSPTTVPARVVR